MTCRQPNFVTCFYIWHNLGAQFYTTDRQKQTYIKNKYRSEIIITMLLNYSKIFKSRLTIVKYSKVA